MDDTLLTLETERLVLRVLDDSYAQKVLDFFLRNREFLAPWELIRDDNFYTVSYHKKELLVELFQIKSGRLLKVWLFQKEDQNFERPIGSIALNNIVRGGFHSCFVGYRMDGDKVSRGYMTEALKKITEYAFLEMNLHRLEANIMPRNSASLRVVEKLGFVNEGISKDYLYINGKWEDHVHMVLLNQDWKSTT